MRAPRVRMRDLPPAQRERAREEKRREEAQTRRQFEALCVAACIPLPRFEHTFHPTRAWRFDAAWTGYRVALEVEGGIWTGGRHTRGAGFLGDMEKYNEAARLGWRLLRCTPEEFLQPATVDLVRATLRATPEEPRG